MNRLKGAALWFLGFAFGIVQTPSNRLGAAAIGVGIVLILVAEWQATTGSTPVGRRD